MNEKTPSPEQETLPELPLSTVRRVLQEYVLADMKGVCTGFGYQSGEGMDDPLVVDEVKAKISRIIREAIGVSDQSVVDKIIAKIDKDIEATMPNEEFEESPAEAYLAQVTDAISEQRKNRSPIEFTTPDVPVPPSEEAPSLGGTVVGRFFRRR